MWLALLLSPALRGALISATPTCCFMVKVAAMTLRFEKASTEPRALLCWPTVSSFLWCEMTHVVHAFQRPQ